VDYGSLRNLLLNPEDSVEVPILEANISISFRIAQQMLSTYFETTPVPIRTPVVFTNKHYQSNPAKQPPRFKPRCWIVVVLVVQANNSGTLTRVVESRCYR
jgi:hypothetical protein